YFFVPAAAADVVRRQAPRASVADVPLRTFAGTPVARVEVALPADVPPLRTRLQGAGGDCLEADLPFAYRWLIAPGIRGGLLVGGASERRPGVGRVYRNPVLEPADFAPVLRVLSLDIETSLDARRLYSIAMAGAGGERVLLVARGPVDGAEVVPDEHTLLQR